MKINIPDIIELKTSTAIACTLKFVFFLLITVAVVFGVLTWEILGYAIDAPVQPNYLTAFLIFVLTLGAVIVSNSFWDVITTTSITKLNSHQIFDSFSSVVKTKTLVLLTASAGIAYIPLFNYLGANSTNIFAFGQPPLNVALAIGGIVWTAHTGIVLFLMRYTDILAIDQPDPFTNIKDSIRLVSSSLLENITFSLLEIASVVGILEGFFYFTNIYDALAITSMLYFLIIRPVFSKISIQLLVNQKRA